jgi:ankyrin repeat protein
VNATGPEPKPERDPDLLAAVKAADLAGAARLLRGGADVNGADAAGYVPLHWAVVKGNAAMVDLLLGQPAIDVDRPDRDGCPALFTAVVLGYVDIVRALVGHPAIDVDARYGEMTALLVAVAVADRALAEILLAKADPTTDANCAGLTIADFLAGTGRLLPVQLSVLGRPWRRAARSPPTAPSPRCSASAGGVPPCSCRPPSPATPNRSTICSITAPAATAAWLGSLPGVTKRGPTNPGSAGGRSNRRAAGGSARLRGNCGCRHR